MSAPVPAQPTDLPVGSRVVVRRRLAVPDPLTGASLSDVVGTLLDRSADSLVVGTRAGTVTVPRAEVVAAKVVPPRPSRRGAPHLALSVDDLQRVMTGAWGALEREPLGDWQLRASRGFTFRGNSVATPGSPGMPLEDALDRAGLWYAARGLPLNVTLAGPVGFAVADDPLGTLLLARGARPVARSLTLTAAAGSVAAAGVGAAPGPTVRLREELTERWLTAYGGYRGGPEGSTMPRETVRDVLTGSRRQWFAEVEDDAGSLVGIGRLAVGDGWGGIAAMWVDPAHRRVGLGRAVLAALARQAQQTGAASLHLQVLADNVVVRSVYAAAGFVPHHEYVNLVLDR